MGGSSSSQRTVTLEQESDSVVEISESVKRRLLGQPDLPESKDNTQDSNHADNRKLKEQYKDKMLDLERKVFAAYGEVREGYEKAVEELEGKFIKTTSSPVCEDLHQTVLKCYQDNPACTLNCSPQVRAFTECVQKQREKMLMPVNRQG